MKYFPKTFSRILFITIVTLSFTFFTFLNSTKAYASEICNSLNSININTNQNLINIQKYLQNYFPQLKISGGNDSQNKFYISKYQYAFGLKNTGILNEETLKFLRKENNCFELENNILKNRTSVIKTIKSQEEIIQNLISNYIYQANGL